MNIFLDKFQKKDVKAKVTSISNNQTSSHDVHKVYFKDNGNDDIQIGVITTSGQRILLDFNKEKKG